MWILYGKLGKNDVSKNDEKRDDMGPEKGWKKSEKRAKKAEKQGDFDPRSWSKKALHAPQKTGRFVWHPHPKKHTSEGQKSPPPGGPPPFFFQVKIPKNWAFFNFQAKFDKHNDETRGSSKCE